jgi:hypothetical protein
MRRCAAAGALNRTLPEANAPAAGRAVFSTLSKRFKINIYLGGFWFSPSNFGLLSYCNMAGKGAGQYSTKMLSGLSAEF